jgi:hypothetical protein
MTLLYIIGSAWLACAAIFCLALAASASRETPETAELQISNIIPLEPYARLAAEDNQVFLQDHQERRAA